jgi:hypothetical protein
VEGLVPFRDFFEWIVDSVGGLLYEAIVKWFLLQLELYATATIGRQLFLIIAIDVVNSCLGIGADFLGGDSGDDQASTNMFTIPLLQRGFNR